VIAADVGDISNVGKQRSRHHRTGKGKRAIHCRPLGCSPFIDGSVAKKFTYSFDILEAPTCRARKLSLKISRIDGTFATFAASYSGTH
jgi:hypothetical protein